MTNENDELKLRAAQYADDLWDNILKSGRRHKSGRSVFEGVMDTLKPLIIEVAELRAMVVQLQQKEGDKS